MKSLPILVVSLVAAFPFQVDAGPINLSKTVQIESITTISTKELWSTAASKSIESGVVIVEQLDIDPEAASVRGEWRACALVLVGTSDTGIKPVSVRVWTPKPCDVSISTVRGANAPGEENFRLKIDGKQTFTIHVTGNQQVSISGLSLGSIDY